MGVNPTKSIGFTRFPSDLEHSEPTGPLARHNLPPNGNVPTPAITRGDVVRRRTVVRRAVVIGPRIVVRSPIPSVRAIVIPRVVIPVPVHVGPVMGRLSVVPPAVRNPTARLRRHRAQKRHCQYGAQNQPFHTSNLHVQPIRSDLAYLSTLFRRTNARFIRTVVMSPHPLSLGRILLLGKAKKQYQDNQDAGNLPPCYQRQRPTLIPSPARRRPTQPPSKYRESPFAPEQTFLRWSSLRESRPYFSAPQDAYPSP